jgi:hypothetical protein
MSADELQLFQMIDNARVDAGCAPLKRDSDLSASAGSEAGRKAESGSNLNSNTDSKSTAGGDDYTAKQAFDRMMSQSRGTMLNCSLTTLGVGQDSAEYNSGFLCGFLPCSDRTRVVWVADFT